MTEQYQLVFLPWVAMGGVSELTVGGATIWNFDSNPRRIADETLRNRITALLQMYREPGRSAGKSRPISDIGVVTRRENDFTPLTALESRDVQELRWALFLCCLSSNTRISGTNGGFMVVTAENFDVVYQNFVLGSDFISERTGVVVELTSLGYTIAETRFTRPAYINRPPRFKHDETLFHQLRLVRRKNRRLYRRLLRAASLFLESYYNNPSVDIGARVLLQAAAFEVLLDLPEKQQRRVFKDEIERLVGRSGERRYAYKYEVYGTKKRESRTMKGIWADRFYTLRNHIIHGESVSEKEYVFRGAQHHLVVAPLMFVFCIKQLIDSWRMSSSKRRAFFERMDWRVIREADQYDPEVRGFQIRDDFVARFSEMPEPRLSFITAETAGG